MKILPQLLGTVTIAGWTIAIAIFSVQNSTPVSLKFLVFQSIRIPVGIVLGLSAGAGAIAGAIAQPLCDLASFRSANSSFIEPEEETEQFEFDE